MTDMESLVKAVSEFVGAVLGVLGFVGRPRRRAGIHDDLELLERLRGVPEFGAESPVHYFLAEHITLEVAKLAGVEVKRKRKIPWSSAVLAVLIGAPLGYWSYKLNQDGFAWFSLVPGVVSGLMLISLFGMFLPETASPGETEQESESAAGTAEREPESPTPGGTAATGT